MANIALIGLGPVGLATAWSLLERGHIVHAYDINPSLVEHCRRGEFPRASDLAPELRAAANSRFFVHSSLGQALVGEAVIICVGTPAGNHGFNLSGLRSALLECRALKEAHSKRHYILRSTLSPGTIRGEILPLLKKSGAFEFSYYPEFLREKFLREDSLQPPIRAVAHSSPEAESRFSELFPGEFQVLKEFASVEALKIASNAFHALKVVFANEMADLCEKSGASAEEMMRAFCEDQKLNLSARYLKPGNPFGGACLDKDLRALECALNDHEIPGDLLRSIRKSNDARLDLLAPAPEKTLTANRGDPAERGKELAAREYSLPAG